MSSQYTVHRTVKAELQVHTIPGSQTWTEIVLTDDEGGRHTVVFHHHVEDTFELIQHAEAVRYIK